MLLMKPSIKCETITENPITLIQDAGRTCYQSETGNAKDFIKKIMDRGHLSVIEHASATYRVICDRGVTHEIVRHRLASYSQESTRYCKYGNGCKFIIPPWIDLDPGECYWEPDDGVLTYSDGISIDINTPNDVWLDALQMSQNSYSTLLAGGWSAQQARSVLPNSLKTEIVMTMNMREWLLFFTLRTDPKAHPQMREIAFLILKDIKKKVPVIFEGVSDE